MANCGILGFAMGMVPPVSPRAPAVDALFVYGTLLSRYVPRGERAIHAPATLRAGHKVGSGLLRKFELCDLGLYPCIVRSNAESQVVGEVYRLQRVGDWGELDEYEGISEEHQAPYEYRREVSGKKECAMKRRADAADV